MSNKPLSVKQALLLAKSHIKDGQLQQAQQLYQAVLTKQPQNKKALAGLKALSKPEQISQNTGISQEQVNALIDLYTRGQLQEALTQGMALERQHPYVLFLPILLGAVYLALGHNEKAVDSYHRALKLKPDDAEVHYNLGIALNNLGQHENAIASYHRALQLKHDNPEIYNHLGIALNAAGQYKEAIASYQKALELTPENLKAYNNLGIALNNLGRSMDAVAIYRKALAINADIAELHYNLGNALFSLNNKTEAAASFQRALEITPNDAKIYNNLGHTFSDLKKLQEAIDSYTRAVSLDKDHLSARCALLNELGNICDWDKIKEAMPTDLKAIKFGPTAKETPSPFSLLALIDDPHFQQRAAEAYALVNHKPAPMPGPIGNSNNSNKIRIGYFSADFRLHPVMSLMIEMYERHDRTRFEIHAFSFGPDKKDELRSQLKKNVDFFHDVRLKGDAEITALSRSLGIDIAVDLNGATALSRTDIFAYQAAPIQVHYLGYPGTMGAAYFDYIIADPIMIPTTHQKFYTEKVAYLPNSYQANISNQEISDKTMSRSDFGLPEEAFVFCCFNNNYKITPDVFDVWMHLLSQINNSVLWLFSANQVAGDNLRKEAFKRGVDPDRLVFADRIPLTEHIARHRLADLFLDTFNYNAHGTASAALWSGLPILTKMGQSFPSRAGASLLSAVGLPEMITTTVQDYEDTALRLATHPDEMKALKAKLNDNLKTAPLFDAPLFTRHIEAAYIEMLKRRNEGLEHDHIYVKP